MKYYLQCKLFDGQNKYLLRPNQHIIQMISIGIVCEDGRSYYALSKDFNSRKAPQDVLENVIVPVCNEFIAQAPAKTQDTISYIVKKKSVYMGVVAVQVHCGKDASTMAKEIADFLTYRHITVQDPEVGPKTIDGNGKPLEIWGYGCEFDWVAICGLFGGLRKIPEQFPHFPLDLAQLIVMCNMGPRWETTTDPDREKTPFNALACAQSHMKLYNSLMVAIEKEPVCHG